jgi:hypothetical protein
MNIPNGVDLCVTSNMYGKFVTHKELIEWLKNEIRIANVNMMAAKESPEYEFSGEEAALSEGEKNAFNHLLTALGEPYYGGYP